MTVDAAQIRGPFNEQDVETLKLLANSSRGWLDRLIMPSEPIISIVAADESTAEITTGRIFGPLCGCGRIYCAKKSDGRWMITKRSWWKS